MVHAGWSQISDPAALPEMSTHASGRGVLTLLSCWVRPKPLQEAAGCKQNPCQSLASTLAGV